MDQFRSNWRGNRIAKYRLKAAQARMCAFNNEKSDIVESFMALARAWETMALELEHADQAGERHVFGPGAKPLPSGNRLR